MACRVFRMLVPCLSKSPFISHCYFMLSQSLEENSLAETQSSYVVVGGSTKDMAWLICPSFTESVCFPFVTWVHDLGLYCIGSPAAHGCLDIGYVLEFFHIICAWRLTVSFRCRSWTLVTLKLDHCIALYIALQRVQNAAACLVSNPSAPWSVLIGSRCYFWPI